MLTLVSCIDEPTIPIPPTQMAVLRIGNFSPNVPSIDVFVDGKAIPTFSNMLYTGLSDYIDINSGNRKITVIKTGTTDTLYNKPFSVSTRNITTILFIGEYNTIDTMNTFQTFEMDEGKTYVSHTPVAGTASFFFYNIITPYITTLPAKDAPVIDFLDYTGGKDLLIIKDVQPKDNVSKAGGSVGFRKFTATVANKPANVLGADSSTTVAGKNYFVFAAGNANAPTVVIRESIPVPVKPR